MANLTREKIEALRSEYKYRSVRGKYPRQKMLPEYKAIYPWVMPDEVDPYFAFCTICECRLSAKRSDLGKHEGSNKHTENAQRKKAMHKAVGFEELSALNEAQQMHMHQTNRSIRTAMGSYEEKDEYDAPMLEPDDEGSTYIKQEPAIELIESSNEPLNLDECNEPKLEDDEEDDSEEEDNDSQHSSMFDYLPVQVTIHEPKTIQQFSIPELPSTTASYFTSNTKTSLTIPQSQYSTPISKPQTQAPCKITIKKITAPITPAVPTPLTSTAKITPVAAIAAHAPLAISHHQHKQSQTKIATSTGTSHELQHASSLLPAHTNSTALPASTPVPVAMHTHTAVPRDSYELFFDSICASVKALPPKLATEGKIRVMQLIGELEMRAITEREEENNSTRSVNATGQQNATVASTTK